MIIILFFMYYYTYTWQWCERPLWTFSFTNVLLNADHYFRFLISMDLFVYPSDELPCLQDNSNIKFFISALKKTWKLPWASVTSNSSEILFGHGTENSLELVSSCDCCLGRLPDKGSPWWSSTDIHSEVDLFFELSFFSFRS